MSLGSTQYTLAGFSAELDWRPLRFVKPIPQNRVCGACGLVRKRTALLPCRHVLCESCYELSTQDGGRVCPLDRQQWEEEDVDLKEFSADELLKRQTKCWNEGYGCGMVLPASEIAQHFQRECRHHSICCPKCSTAILCTDIWTHLNSECCAAVTTAAQECEGTSSNNEERAPLTSFRQSLEEHAGEMKAIMERLLVAYDAIGDHLNEVGHGVNSCQEALREELGECVSRVEDTVRQEVEGVRTVKILTAEITALNEEMRKALTEELRQGMRSVMDTVRQEAEQVRTELRDSVQKCSEETAALNEETKARFAAGTDSMKTISNDIHGLEKVLGDEMAKVVNELRVKSTQFPVGPEDMEAKQVEEGKIIAACGLNKGGPKPPYLPATVYEFVVTSVTRLRQIMFKQGRTPYSSDPIYLGGYYLSPGIVFFDDKLSALFRLHKGDMDDVIEWPFQQTIMLTLVHPKGFAGRMLTVHPDKHYSRCERPQEGLVQEPCISMNFLSLKDAIRDGYVEGNQLRVKFELLP